MGSSGYRLNGGLSACGPEVIKIFFLAWREDDGIFRVRLKIFTWSEERDVRAVETYREEERLVFFLQQPLAGPGRYFPISHFIVFDVKGTPVKRLSLGLPGCAVARHAVEGEDKSLTPGFDDVAWILASLARQFLPGVAGLVFLSGLQRCSVEKYFSKRPELLLWRSFPVPKVEYPFFAKCCGR